MTENKNDIINDRDERYEDWCFDCGHCTGNTCPHALSCEDGEQWTPQEFEDDCDE